VSRVCDAATAHWLRISLSQRLPLVVLPERRLPPVMSTTSTSIAIANWMASRGLPLPPQER
jgi:hypothetical protein